MAAHSSLISLAIILATTPAAQAAGKHVPDSPEARVAEAYGKLPLSFEANAGQTDKEVKFLSRGNGHVLFLTPTETVLVQSRRAEENKTPNPGTTTVSQGTETSVLRIRLQGANAKLSVVGEQELTGKSNYLIGKNPKNWHTNVTRYARVKYQQVYPGIDLVFYGNQGQLEYDLVIAPGADPNVIALGVEGADKIRIDAHGDLVLTTKLGEVKQRKPVIYQEIAGKRQEIKGNYTLKSKNEIGFKLAYYDRSRTLVIDPVLSLAYSTYLGGTDVDGATAIAVDASGNAFVTGVTSSTDFPVANALQSQKANSDDAFVTKLNPVGDTLVYSTYLGGESIDSGQGIAVDASGNAYVTGTTYSTDFPVVNAIQPQNGGTSDAFITKLNPAGDALVYSTYLGGSDLDNANAIAVTANGYAHATGDTYSTDFPVANALQPQFQSVSLSETDAFVTKLNPAGDTFVYSTYLGGALFDFGQGIAVDPRGNAYVTGETGSPNFPIANALQPELRGDSDAFVTKLTPSGNTFIYSTYLGGDRLENGTAVAVNPSGYAFVTGGTNSTNFPIANAIQSELLGDSDAFVSKLKPAGDSFLYSTYLGGSGTEAGAGIAVDGNRNAYVIGDTHSTDFPIAHAVQSQNAGGNDAFVTTLSARGETLVYSTYLGGSNTEFSHGIAVTANGDAYVAGTTSSANFPLANALQSKLRGDSDAFVAKLTSQNKGSVKFDYFDVKVDVKESAFSATGTFVLGKQSDGFDPVTETLVFALNDLTITLPPDSLTSDQNDGYTFDGTVDGIRTTFKLEPEGNGAYDFTVEGATEPDLPTMPARWASR